MYYKQHSEGQVHPYRGVPNFFINARVFIHHPRIEEHIACLLAGDSMFFEIRRCFFAVPDKILIELSIENVHTHVYTIRGWTSASGFSRPKRLDADDQVPRHPLERLPQQVDPVQI